MGLLFSTLVAAALVTNASGSTSNGVDRASGFALPAGGPENAVEQAYRRLLDLDDAAQVELDRWIKEADALGENADGAALQSRIDAQIAAVDAAYKEFLEQHPRHAKGRIAHGSFLNDTGREFKALEEWEKARDLDPQNPAVYNNLAGIYGHRGPVTNAFVCYEKAIELEPTESVYYQNLATVVYLFRRDVKEHYGINDEQKIFDKALALYRKALELDPDNFILATELAQTYYGIKPLRFDEAHRAWSRAYELASDDLERQGIRVHLARIQLQAGRYAEARTSLGQVTNENYRAVTERLARLLEKRENPAPLESQAVDIPPAVSLPASP